MENDFIFPGSFQKITEKFNMIMGHFIAFKRVSDEIKVCFKNSFQAIVKDYIDNPNSAK